MKIVIAPDSFKDSLSAAQVARAIADGINRVIPGAECVIVPVADGGEGTVRALVDATGGREFTRQVRGPLQEPVRARFGLLGDGATAVIEMAAASGLELVPPERRNPMQTTSFGTGELMRAALRKGARRIIVGIGGSATTDGGAGMAQALGIRFLDRDGKVLENGLGGGDLERVHRIDMRAAEPDLSAAEVVVACDVNNRLLGKRGAARVYGPQKGASPAEITILERNLAHFAERIRRDLGTPVRALAGGGAAGGLGAGLVAFAGGRLQRGAEIVIEAVELERKLRGAKLVVTGEGRIDQQTAYGKAPAAVAALAVARGIPVVGIGGSLADNAAGAFEHGFDALESAIARDMPLDQALRHARRNLLDAGVRLGHWLLLAERLAGKSRGQRHA